MLADLQVVEISSASTMLAGSILGDLGADVLVIEPQHGAEGRRLEPFIGDIPGIERSLTWHAFNRNKRSITLNHHCPDGRSLLREICADADIVLSSAGAISPDDLPAKAVHCEISPFSRNGPKAKYAATDLVLMAASGAPAMAGPPDRPPLFFPVPQAMLEAGGEAAIAALAGLAVRDATGEPDNVEVVARVAAMMSAFSRSFSGFARETTTGRSAVASVGFASARSAPVMYECNDGHVLISIVFGTGFIALTKQVVRWAVDEGELDQHFLELDWLQIARGSSSGERESPEIEALVAAVTRLSKARTKLELAEIGRRYGLMVAPVFDMADIAVSEQHHARELFDTIGIRPADRNIIAPTRHVQFSNYRIETCRPAPSLSEHTYAVLTGKLGLSSTEVQALFAHGVI